MAFKVSVPYSGTPISLETVKSWVNLPVTQNDLFSTMMEESSVRTFNGHLLAAISVFPDNYAMVIASRTDNNENTVRREFMDCYDESICDVFAIQLTPNGDWKVATLDEAEDRFVPADTFEGLEGLTHLMNTLRDHYLQLK